MNREISADKIRGFVKRMLMMSTTTTIMKTMVTNGGGSGGGTVNITLVVITLSVSPSHSILTPGQPVPALTL